MQVEIKLLESYKMYTYIILSRDFLARCLEVYTGVLTKVSWFELIKIKLRLNIRIK